jgi:hypothetical protein
MYYAEIYAPTGHVEIGLVVCQTNERHQVATRESGGREAAWMRQTMLR